MILNHSEMDLLFSSAKPLKLLDVRPLEFTCWRFVYIFFSNQNQQHFCVMCNCLVILLCGKHKKMIKFWVNMSRNRINRLSLSPDPPATNTAASIKYNSGLVRQQQERNSPSYQSYKKVHIAKYLCTYK